MLFYAASLCFAHSVFVCYGCLNRDNKPSSLTVEMDQLSVLQIGSPRLRCGRVGSFEGIRPRLLCFWNSLLFLVPLDVWVLHPICTLIFGSYSPSRCVFLCIQFSYSYTDRNPANFQAPGGPIFQKHLQRSSSRVKSHSEN